MSQTHVSSAVTTPRHPRVAIIVVHYRGMEDTIECLQSLAHVEHPQTEVVLVSSGSPDFDERLIRARFPHVVVIVVPTNIGFAGANNVGIRHALRAGVDYVLLLNPDTTVEPQLISALLPALREPRVGIAGPVITYYDRPDTTWFAGGTYSRLLGYPMHPGAGRRLGAKVPDHDVDYINGCAMMISRAALEEIGLLSEEFFLYFEEVEYCLRARAARYRCRLVGQPLVRHKVSASSGTRGSDAVSVGKAYYFGRNPILVLRATSRGLWRGAGLLSQFLVVLPYHAWRAARAGATSAMFEYLRGMWDGIMGKTGARSALTAGTA